MREIKFRAWNKKKKVMVDEDMESHDWELCWESDLSMLNSILAGQKERYIFMQYTGLKDSNGVEIYEGDIVKQYYYLDISPHDLGEFVEGHHVGEVIITASKGVCMRNPLNIDYDSGESSVSNQYKNVAGYRAEVIGNIYENPELLERL